MRVELGDAAVDLQYHAILFRSHFAVAFFGVLGLVNALQRRASDLTGGGNRGVGVGFAYRNGFNLRGIELRIGRRGDRNERDGER